MKDKGHFHSYMCLRIPSIRTTFPVAPLSMKEMIPPCSTDVGGGHWLVLRVELRKTRVLKRSYAAIRPAVYNREPTASPSAAFVSSSWSLGCVLGNFHFTTAGIAWETAGRCACTSATDTPSRFSPSPSLRDVHSPGFQL